MVLTSYKQTSPNKIIFSTPHNIIELSNDLEMDSRINNIEIHKSSKNRDTKDPRAMLLRSELIRNLEEFTRIKSKEM